MNSLIRRVIDELIALFNIVTIGRVKRDLHRLTGCYVVNTDEVPLSDIAGRDIYQLGWIMVVGYGMYPEHIVIMFPMSDFSIKQFLLPRWIDSSYEQRIQEIADSILLSKIAE